MLLESRLVYISQVEPFHWMLKENCMKNKLLVIFLNCLLILCLGGQMAWAAPSVKRSGSTFTITEGVTEEVMAAIAKDIGQTKAEFLEFKLEKFTQNDDLAKICAAYPEMAILQIKSSQGITSIEPVGALSKLNKVVFSDVGVQDFSPLSNCPELREFQHVNYDKGKVDFTTLGKVTQLTKIWVLLHDNEDISWLAGLSNLQRLLLFGGNVVDYSPLAKLPLEILHLDGAKKPVGDLGFLSGISSLETLDISNSRGVSNFAALKGLVNLTKLRLNLVNVGGGEAFDFAVMAQMAELNYLYLQRTPVASTKGAENLPDLEYVALFGLGEEGKPIDLSFLGGHADLETVLLRGSVVSNFESIAACKQIEEVGLEEVQGVSNLESLKKLPELTKLSVSKGAFPEAELTGFANTDLEIDILE